MPSLQFGIRGQPVPKQSFKVASRGHGYTEPRVKAWQDTVQLIALLARNDQCPEWKKDCVYSVQLNFFLGDLRPRDNDNLSKAVLDGCNGVIWDDDKQVKNLFILKEIVGKSEAGVLVYIVDIDPLGLNILEVLERWDNIPTYAE